MGHWQPPYVCAYIYIHTHSIPPRRHIQYKGPNGYQYAFEAYFRYKILSLYQEDWTGFIQARTVHSLTRDTDACTSTEQNGTPRPSPSSAFAGRGQQLGPSRVLHTRPTISPCTWNPKVCKTMAIWALFRSFGPSCCVHLGSRCLYHYGVYLRYMSTRAMIGTWTHDIVTY